MQPQYTSSDVSRFWSKVNRTDNPDECWEWTAYVDAHGYGYLHSRGHTAKAHRTAWQLTNGPIPEGLCVCHSCDNPGCCNPAHLWLGTQDDNIRDRHAKGRTSRVSRAWTPQKLTAALVIEIRTRYAAGGINYSQLAREYGVDHHTIISVVQRKTWAHVD